MRSHPRFTSQWRWLALIATATVIAVAMLAATGALTQPVGAVPIAAAAAFSEGRVSMFAKAPQYDFLMRCVKDRVTQVNSGHRNRMTQPKNVQVMATP